MPVSTRFEDFQAADFGRLQAMVEALYAEDPGGEPMTVEKLRRSVAAQRRLPGSGRFLLFRVGEETVGYALLLSRWSNEHGGRVAIVDELYVAPAWRGLGIAREFLREAPRLAGGEVVGVELEVSPHNRRALALYQRLGFSRSPNLHLFRRMPRNPDGSH